MGWVMKDLLDYEKHLEFFFKSDEVSSLVDPVFKNPPCTAGDMGLIAGWGNMVPQTREQLSLCTATAETAHHN